MTQQPAFCNEIIDSLATAQADENQQDVSESIKQRQLEYAKAFEEATGVPLDQIKYTEERAKSLSSADERFLQLQQKRLEEQRQSLADFQEDISSMDAGNLKKLQQVTLQTLTALGRERTVAEQLIRVTTDAELANAYQQKIDKHRHMQNVAKAIRQRLDEIKAQRRVKQFSIEAVKSKKSKR